MLLDKGSRVVMKQRNQQGRPFLLVSKFVHNNHRPDSVKSDHK